MQESLRYSWLLFVPDIHDQFFLQAEHQILSQLKVQNICMDRGGAYRRPSQCIILTGEFCDSRGNPLIPPQSLPDGKVYLSESYNSSARDILGRLGIQTMSFGILIYAVRSMGVAISRQSDDWHEEICQKLRRLSHSVQDLCLIPLSDGTWVSSYSAQSDTIYFYTASTPPDLGMRFVKRDIANGSSRYYLFASLGVKEPDTIAIGNKIMAVHKSREAQRLSLEALISHATFMFKNRHFRNLPLARELQIVNDRREYCHGSDVYLDRNHFSKTVPLQDIPASARFLHVDYNRCVIETTDEREEWEEWLCSHIQVSRSLRLGANGNMSSECYELFQSANSSRRIDLLKEVWPEWKHSISTHAIQWLSNLSIVCEDNTTQLLKNTYLKRTYLIPYPHLAFLPIRDPNSDQWDFLLNLGVTECPNISLYLRELRRLHDSSEHGLKIDRDSIIHLYEEILDNFVQDSSSVRSVACTLPAMIIIDVSSSIIETPLHRNRSSVISVIN